jgi:hypothetical protein
MQLTLSYLFNAELKLLVSTISLIYAMLDVNKLANYNLLYCLVGISKIQFLFLLLFSHSHR